MSVMVSVAVSQVGMTELIFFCRPWGEGERPVLLRCLAVSVDTQQQQQRRHRVQDKPQCPSEEKFN